MAVAEGAHEGSLGAKVRLCGGEQAASLPATHQAVYDALKVNEACHLRWISPSRQDVGPLFRCFRAGCRGWGFGDLVVRVVPS